MTDEQRLQMITEQLILVRDNLFRGMSKSIQKLQARNINEVLELENFTQSPQRTWVGLTDGEVDKMILLMGFPPDWITENAIVKNIVRNLEAKLKEKNT